MSEIIPAAKIVSTVEHHLRGRTVTLVQDRGVWIRHNFRVNLDGGEVVYLKVDRRFSASEKEAYICELLRAHNLPAPRILALDTTCSWLPSPFVIQEYAGGEQLGALLARVDASEKPGIYRALGRFYRRLHSIHHDHSGWIEGAGTVLPFSPCEHQYEEVIVKIGGEAVERGLLAADAHQRLERLWSENLAWLKVHQPSMVTGEALGWTVYLALEDEWRVTKIMDLHDLLYWDSAWDLASIKYPVFREPPTEELWGAFVSEYGSVPSLKRLQLYRLMQYLEAALGNYLEPVDPEHERWKQRTWQAYDGLLDEVESL